MLSICNQNFFLLSLSECKENYRPLSGPMLFSPVLIFLPFAVLDASKQKEVEKL
jgi:hypothetical protein